MSSPTFEDYIDPLLRLVAETGPIKKREYEDKLADVMGLGETERAEMIPSGKSQKFRHRIGWAATHLRKAKLLYSPVKATLQVTPRGIEVLNESPSRIDVEYLKRFPEHLEFVTHKRGKQVITPAPVKPTSGDPPLERLEDAFAEYQDSLASDLLEQIMLAPPDFFEQLVVEVLVAMGYGGTLQDAGQAIGKSGDGGIDGVIKEDRLGLDSIYIQAKRWQGNVQTPEIQKFVGALAGRNASRGVFITSSDFTSGARAYVSQIQTKIILLNGQELADLMIEYGVGVIDEETYRVKRVDPEYFGE